MTMLLPSELRHLQTIKFKINKKCELGICLVDHLLSSTIPPLLLACHGMSWCCDTRLATHKSNDFTSINMRWWYTCIRTCNDVFDRVSNYFIVLNKNILRENSPLFNLCSPLLIDGWPTTLHMAYPHFLEDKLDVTIQQA